MNYYSQLCAKVFVADFEHVFVRWEIYRIIVVLILKYLFQQKILTQSERTTETLKQDVKSVER